jgi:hypothetical protein
MEYRSIEISRMAAAFGGHEGRVGGNPAVISVH